MSSILKNNSKLSLLNKGEKEGERLINVSPKSHTLLGKMLSPITTSNTILFCGRVGSIKTFMEAIKTPDFPTDYLTKPFLLSAEIEKIPRKKVRLPNYWALVAYAVVERVKQDKKLISLLKANTLELTALEKDKEVDLFGKKFVVPRAHEKLGFYIAIVRCIEKMIKDGTFDSKEKVDEFILECRDDIEKDIFANICIPLEEVK